MRMCPYFWLKTCQYPRWLERHSLTIDLILPPERQIIVKGQRVAMLENPNESHDHPAALRAAKSYVIPPSTQLTIKVSCSRTGLCVIQQTLKKTSGSRPFIDNGLVELPPAFLGRHSTVMMQEKPLRFPKSQIIGVADQLTCLLLSQD
jgi:hypothetical protein